MKRGRLQAKDIPDLTVLGIIDDIERRQNKWTLTYDLRDRLSVPYKLVVAKADALIRRKLITGCSCGCNGQFELTAKGEETLAGSLKTEAAGADQAASSGGGGSESRSRR